MFLEDLGLGKNIVKTGTICYEVHTNADNYKYDDFELEKFLADTKKCLSIHSSNSKMKITTAYDGMELEV